MTKSINPISPYRTAILTIIFLSLSYFSLFSQANYTEITKLLAQTSIKSLAGDQYGYSTSIDGDYAAIGAPQYNDDIGGDRTGATYIMKRTPSVNSGWSIIQVITASDAAANDQFGRSVSISGNTIIVGAPGHDNEGITFNSGVVYIFEKDTGGMGNWSEVKKITASDAAAGDNFGSSVSISGDLVAVGSMLNDNGGSNSGAAYVYEKDMGGIGNWGEVKKLIASDAAADDYFGHSVSINGSTAVVGAYRNSDAGNKSGSAYIFEKDAGGTDNWSEVKKITASDAAAGDSFGWSVSISGSKVAIGANFSDDDNQGLIDLGSAYIYEKDAGGTDNWGEVKKLTASDAAAGDSFGWSVSISGSKVAIGANFSDNDIGNNSSAAYIFEKDTGGIDNWGEIQKLTVLDAETGDYFGYSVSISDTTVIIGARLNDDGDEDSGAVYFYEEDEVDNWAEVNITSPVDFFPLGIYSDAEASANFGLSVAISNNIAIVGAYNNDSGDTNSGAAYIYEKNAFGAWRFLKKITASDAAANDYFGISVSISGSTAVIGAYNNDEGGSNSGAAYIFEKNEGGTNNWGEVKKLTASDAAAGDIFGTSVSINNSTVVIGAYNNDEGGSNSGAAYVFEKNAGGIDNWGEIKKLTASNAAAGDTFGCSVSVSGSIIVIGARLNDESQFWAGAAYIFEKNEGGSNNWGEIKKLAASDAAANDHFGTSVSISSNTIIVGAEGDDESGSAYIFKKDEGGIDNWGEIKKLGASDAAADDTFGYSVSVNDDIVVVGAKFHDDGSINSGAAYIYEKDAGGVDNWGEIKKLSASDAALGDNFGTSISLYGTTIIVGANANDDGASGAGSAYIFDDICITLVDVTSTPENCPNSNNGSITITANCAACNENDLRYSINGGTLQESNEFTELAAGSYTVRVEDVNDATCFSTQTTIVDAPVGLSLPFEEINKLVASDAAAGDLFGYSVSISGNRAIIGAYGDSDAGTNTGSAYIYEWDGSMWIQSQKLTASDAAAGDYFGRTVSISGNRAIVGAYRDDDADTDTGSAYIYEWDGNTWNETKITASDAAASDRFGISVSILGDRAVIGAYQDDDAGSNAGSVYFYEWDGSTWNETKLTASDAAASDRFGVSVNISGNRAIIGAYGDSDAGTSSGSAYIYEWDGNTWNETKLTASDAADSDLFGIRVSISGNRAIVGAFGNNDAGTSSGSAYIYEWDGSTWNETKLTASDATAGDYFGSRVSISGNRAIIGAYLDDGVGSESGSAYFYEWDGSTWNETKITASDETTGDRFGISVGLSGGRAVVGSYHDDDAGSDAGSMYFYEGTSLAPEVSIVGGSTPIEIANGDSTPSMTDSTHFGTQLVGTTTDHAFFIKNIGNATLNLSGSPIVAISGDSDFSILTQPSAAAIDSEGADLFFMVRYAPSIVGIHTATIIIENDDCDENLYTFEVSGEAEQNCDLVISNISSTNETCLGEADGSITIMATCASCANGIADLRYFLNDGTPQVSNEFTGLPVGTYTVKVEDINDATCFSTQTTTVDYPSDLPLSFTEIDKLTASDAAANDNFGLSVSISGNRAIIGAYGSGNGAVGSSPGSAYLYEWDGNMWIQTQKLTASDAAFGDNFGISVSIADDLVVVGANGNDDAGSSSGSAYIYEWDGNMWNETQKLTASDAAASDFFGSSVSISGNRTIIGASLNDDAGSSSGSAYIYEWDGSMWLQTQKLTASDAANDDRFGFSVGISDNRAIVGANRNDDSGSNSGSAYIYEWDGVLWNETKIVASDAATSDLFGWSVSISGNRAIVGTHQNEDNGSNSGSAYIYEWDGVFWNESKIVASDAAADDRFGFNVSISDNQAIIGAHGNDDSGSSSGSAYIYEWNGNNWVQIQKMTASDGSTEDQFGISVSISGDRAIIGASQDDDDGSNSGSAYFYEAIPSSAEISIAGGNTPTEITNGDTTPDVTDDTDFGTQSIGTTTDHTFIIKNTGNATLNLSGSPIVAISGDSDFSVLTQPSATTIPNEGADLSFVVRYAPSVAGTNTATIIIENDDCDENLYTFDVTGQGEVTCDVAITEVSFTDENCPNANDGTITVMATCTTCTGLIEYSIDNGLSYLQNDGIFTGLSDDTYTVKVRDADDNTCTATHSTTTLITAGADTEGPTAICQDVTVQLDANGTATLSPAEVNNGSFDNCTAVGDLNFTLSQTSFSCDDIGVESTWENVGMAGFSDGQSFFQSLAFHNGEPYVAYSDNAHGNKTTVMKYNGSTWENIGSAGFSAGQASFQSLAFHNNEPYVAYSDNIDNIRKATVMKYNGSNWENVGTAGFSSSNASFQSLVFYNDEPYVAFQDDATGGKTTVMKYNGSNWENVGMAGFSTGFSRYQSLAFYNGEPYVAFSDVAIGEKTRVMKYNGSSWENIGIEGFSAGSSSFQSLAFHNGEPYVAYSDHVNGYKTTMMKYNGSNWENVGTAGFSAGQSSFQSLVFHNGEPYVAYRDNGNVSNTTVMKYNGSTWENVGTAGFSNGSAEYQSLAFYNGEPYVAYSDISIGFNKTVVMKFSSNLPNTTLTVIDASNIESTCNANVTVQNNITLQAICPSTPLLVILNNNEMGILSANALAGNSTDNCTNNLTETSPETTFDCSQIGTQMVTLTATDGTNTDTEMCAVIVQDNSNPIAICPTETPVVTLDIDGIGTLTANALAGNSTDNCTNNLTETSPETTFDCSQVGTQMVTLTATDGTNTDTEMCAVNVQDLGEDNDMDGFTVCEGDCDDTNPNIYPNAPEILDGLDNDCDDLVDSDDPDYIDIPSNAFVTKWTVSSDDLSIFIPTFENSGSYNYAVNWGDGTSSSGQTANAFHNYQEAGTYTVSITGTFPHFYLNGRPDTPGGNHLKIVSIEQWGNIQWSTMKQAFTGAENMEYHATDAPNLSNVTDCSSMFSKTTNLGSPDLTNWDVSNVQQMLKVFEGSNFTGNVSNWDMNGVTITTNMFKNSPFNGDLSMWDMSTVQHTAGMFNGATSFNQDISSWNLNNVKFMLNMFQNASSFDQDLGNWNMTDLFSTLSLYNIFSGSGMSTASYDATLIGWEAQDVPDGIYVGAQGVQYCQSREARQRLIDEHRWRFFGDELDGQECADLPFVTTWETTNNSRTITIYTNENFNYNFDVDWGDGQINSNVTGEISHTYTPGHSMPATHTISISGEFPHFKVEDNSYLLKSVEQWGSIEWESMSFSFAYAENMTVPASDAPNLSQVTNMEYMFLHTKSFNSDLNHWDVSKVENMRGTFAYSNFNGDISRWDVSNAKDMKIMFYYATSFNQNIGSWTVSNVQDMSFMFYYATSFNQNLGSWDISGLNTTSSLYGTLDYSDLNVENYDNTLIGWAAQAQNVPYGMSLGADDLRYCNTVMGRDILISSPYNWVINYDLYGCPTIQEPNIETSEAQSRSNQTKILQLYPNPTSQLVNIYINHPEQTYSSLKIYDNLGKVVWSQQLEAGQSEVQIPLVVHRFISGLYTVSLRTKNSIHTEKLMIIK